MKLVIKIDYDAVKFCVENMTFEEQLDCLQSIMTYDEQDQVDILRKMTKNEKQKQELANFLLKKASVPSSMYDCVEFWLKMKCKKKYSVDDYKYIVTFWDYYCFDFISVKIKNDTDKVINCSVEDFARLIEPDKHQAQWDDPIRVAKLMEQWRKTDNYKQCIDILKRLGKE